MKTLVLAFLCLCVTSAVAEVERSLKKSPDGRFEVILTAEKAEDLGLVEVREVSSGKSFETESGQGYGWFGNSNVEVEWKAESDAFAVSFQGTKTSYHTDVYVRAEEGWVKLDMPPYVDNILGRQGVVNKGRNHNESFGGFLKDNQFIIFCTVEPNFQEKEATKYEGWTPSDNTDWQVVLEYNLGHDPNCDVMSIEMIEFPEKKGANKAGVRGE